MANRDVFSKILPNVKLGTRYDEDGREVQVSASHPAGNPQLNLISITGGASRGLGCHGQGAGHLRHTGGSRILSCPHQGLIRIR